MAAYNAARTIETAVKSVLYQTTPPVELIIVDDGSTDNTRQVVAGIDAPYLRVISQTNQGPSAARNAGIAAATGEFIACIDADDIWLEDKLAAQRQALQNNENAVLAYGWANIVDDDLKYAHPDQRAVHAGDVYQYLLRENFIVSGSNSMMLRSAVEKVGGFDTSLMAVEDWELHVRLAAVGAFVCVPSVVVNYRKSQHSLSSNTALMEASFLAAKAKIFAVAPNRHAALESKCTAAFYAYLTARALQTIRMHRSPRLVSSYLLTSLRHDFRDGLKLLRLLNPFGPSRLAVRAMRSSLHRHDKANNSG